MQARFSRHPLDHRRRELYKDRPKPVPFRQALSDAPRCFFCCALVAALGASVSAGGERLVYSNTTGGKTFPAPAGFIVSDDILTSGVSGCSLSRYSFMVTGNADGNGTGGFSVEHALYDGCPGQGGRVISGTWGRTELPDEGIHVVSFEVPPDSDVSLPETFWIGLKFDRNGAGWVGGNPALEGFTNSTFGDPLFSCWTPLGGGFPLSPWGGFNAEVYVRGTCAATFRGYHAQDNRIGTFPTSEGVRIAEDLQLSVDHCRLRAYEVTFRGTGQLDVDLRTVDGLNNGLPADVLPGTHLAFSGSTNRLQVARKDFPNPIPVPQRLWLTIQTDTSIVTPTVVRNPVQAGSTDGQYAVFRDGVWQRVDFTGLLRGSAFEISLICDGAAPVGACCDMFVTDENGESVCRDVAEMNCPFPPPGTSLLPKWRVGDTCASMPFDPPCGRAACCGADGVCANLTENQCNVNGVSWSRGKYCDNPEIACEFVCVPSAEDCTLPHQSRGCADPFCCRAVCSLPFEDFCCEVEWDEGCVAVTSEVCAIPPSNDECAPIGDLEGARLISVPGSVESDGIHATENPGDPGFCCHTQQPGAPGVGTVWYKFIATDTSVKIATCGSAPPAVDSLVRVFAVGNPKSDETSCNTLLPIGCNDDQGGVCGFSSRNSQLCLHDLIVGDPYYIMVASKSEETRGRYRLDITSPCNDPPPPVCPCPVGSVRWVLPQSGIIDARRPHPANDLTMAEGISIFTAETPREADRAECWSVCGSPDLPPGNTIADLFETNGVMTSLVLQHAITPGTSTLIAYTDGSGAVTRGVFTSHPGNVNADQIADAQDVFWVVGLLSGLVELPFDLASGDINRSGRITSLDILEEIDLLNGAGSFQAWNQTPRPIEPSSCP